MDSIYWVHYCSVVKNEVARGAVAMLPNLQQYLLTTLIAASVVQQRTISTSKMNRTNNQWTLFGFQPSALCCASFAAKGKMAHIMTEQYHFRQCDSPLCTSCVETEKMLEHILL